MTATSASVTGKASGGFLARFISLSVLAGATIGTGNVITTLFALHLGASSLQVGLISGAATLGMMAVTLPAGFLIARYGAKRIYLLASVNCAAIYLIVPWLTLWPALAVARALVGASVPFRTVSMNSTFLQRVRELGLGKAGWYRASQNIGMAVIGPWLGTALTGSSSFLVSYVCLAAMFLGMALWSQNFLPEAEVAPPVDAGEATGFLQQIRSMLGDVWVGESCLTEFVNSSTTSLFSSFILVLAVKQFAWPIGQGVALITTQGVTMIVALFVLGPLLHRIRIGYAYAASVVLASVALLSIGLGNSLPVLMAGAACLALAGATIHLVNMNRLAGSTLPKSKISGLLNLAGQTGSLVGSVGGGLLSVAIGVHHIFLAWVPLLWLAALFCLWRFHSTRRIA